MLFYLSRYNKKNNKGNTCENIPASRCRHNLLAVKGLKGYWNVHLEQTLVLGKEPVICDSSKPPRLKGYGKTLEKLSEIKRLFRASQKRSGRKIL